MTTTDYGRGRFVDADKVEHRIRLLDPTPAELDAVEEGVRRTLTIWATTQPGPRHQLPTADEAMRTVGVGWRRQASLLNLVLLLAAYRGGRSLGYRVERQEEP